MKTQKFVSVHQTVGEDVRDYLLRVERLSKEVGSFASDDGEILKQWNTIRGRFSVVIAINGLRDPNLRREFMQKDELDWTEFSKRVKCRGRAQDAESHLVLIKQEPGVGECNWFQG